MYKCLKLPLDKVKIDRMSDDNGNNASYVRISYNGYYFYFSYHNLRPVTTALHSLESIEKTHNVYIVAYKTSYNSYEICWLGDCDHIEFRMRDTEKDRGNFGFLSVLFGMVSIALTVGAYHSSSTDTFVIYIVFLLVSLFGLGIILLCFFESSSDKSIQFRKLMRKNLMQEKDLFSSFTDVSECCKLEQHLKLLKELSQSTVTVESVYRERRNVFGQYYNTATNSTLSTSYTKCMINMVCDGGKFTFEYKESAGGVAPFIAKGDKAILYWYEPEYEEIPCDHEDITYGTRLICLHNLTTDKFYQSRLNIDPGNVFKIVQEGGRDMYESYSLY